MKKRYSLIFTITAAAVLVGSIAYASKKKLQPKLEPLKQEMSEVDLAANLMDSGKGQMPATKEDYSKKVHGDSELKDLSMLDKLVSPDKVPPR
ncbi:MAG: hypothetical protein HGB32_05500 [Geobacteraceae bacterium]|nr:hypothetical protein [Geobacteraceae bacterium]NTW79586.1 hypothetical protein [Geobacteraceae bacterium]